ncbi:MAG: hypothetical protein HQ522_14825 [Bacteroidetes bacterium]|nr:hypothetical protein [Bacteroidota bacterium]
MKLLKNINKGFFLIFSTLIGIMTILSFFAAWAKDEGTIGDSIVWNVFAYMFNIFRFPTHNLLWDWMNGGLFFIGLILNTMLYGLILERILNLIINKRK